MIEEEREVKQAYMRKAILEPGYNPEAFLTYLNSVKTDGTDIDNWTLEELKTEVQNYKKCYFVEEASKDQMETKDSAIHRFLDAENTRDISDLIKPINQKKNLQNNESESEKSEVHDEIEERKEGSSVTLIINIGRRECNE